MELHVPQENGHQILPENEPQLIPDDVLPDVEPEVVLEVEPEGGSEDESESGSEDQYFEPEISEDEWNELFKKGRFKKQDMDMMVMDFLIQQELPIVAEVFHKESGCPLDSEVLSKVGTQKIVRDLILNRQIDDAICTLNETMTPSFFEQYPMARYRLEQQKMIELCRKHDLDAALRFSREFVTWESFESGYLLRDCRQTLSLMVHGDDQESPASALLDYIRIFLLALGTVDAMIKYQGRQTGNYIEKALKMLECEESGLFKVAEIPYFDFNSGYPKVYK